MNPSRKSTRALRVFGANYCGKSRRVVACKTKTEAGRLIGLTDSTMQKYGGETHSAEEIQIAFQEPGTVFEYLYREEKGPEKIWRKVVPVDNC